MVKKLGILNNANITFPSLKTSTDFDNVHIYNRLNDVWAKRVEDEILGYGWDGLTAYHSWKDGLILSLPYITSDPHLPRWAGLPTG